MAGPKLRERAKGAWEGWTRKGPEGAGVIKIRIPEIVELSERAGEEAIDSLANELAARLSMSETWKSMLGARRKAFTRSQMLNIIMKKMGPGVDMTDAQAAALAEGLMDEIMKTPTGKKNFGNLILALYKKGHLHQNLVDGYMLTESFKLLRALNQIMQDSGVRNVGTIMEELRKECATSPLYEERVVVETTERKIIHKVEPEAAETGKVLEGFKSRGGTVEWTEPMKIEEVVVEGALKDIKKRFNLSDDVYQALVARIKSSTVQERLMFGSAMNLVEYAEAMEAQESRLMERILEEGDEGIRKMVNRWMNRPWWPDFKKAFWTIAKLPLWPLKQIFSSKASWKKFGLAVGLIALAGVGYWVTTSHLDRTKKEEIMDEDLKLYAPLDAFLPVKVKDENNAKKPALGKFYTKHKEIRWRLYDLLAKLEAIERNPETGMYRVRDVPIFKDIFEKLATNMYLLTDDPKEAKDQIYACPAIENRLSGERKREAQQAELAMQPRFNRLYAQLFDDMKKMKLDREKYAQVPEEIPKSVIPVGEIESAFKSSKVAGKTLKTEEWPNFIALLKQIPVHESVAISSENRAFYLETIKDFLVNTAKISDTDFTKPKGRLLFIKQVQQYLHPYFSLDPDIGNPNMAQFVIRLNLRDDPRITYSALVDALGDFVHKKSLMDLEEGKVKDSMFARPQTQEALRKWLRDFLPEKK